MSRQVVKYPDKMMPEACWWWPKMSGLHSTCYETFNQKSVWVYCDRNDRHDHIICALTLYSSCSFLQLTATAFQLHPTHNNNHLRSRHVQYRGGMMSRWSSGVSASSAAAPRTTHAHVVISSISPTAPKLSFVCLSPVISSKQYLIHLKNISVVVWICSF